MTGTVCAIQIPEEKTFEWKIDDFLQIEDRWVESPEFCFSDASWRIDIWPRGAQRNESSGYIGLYLLPVSLPEPLAVTMTLSFRTVDGKSELEDTRTEFIDRAGIWTFYRPKVISRSHLIQRRSELVPSGALTVICTLKKGEPSAANEHKLQDVSAQTSEMTAIRKLQKHLHEISLSGEISDVILKVEDQEFKSHRCILAARSPVFMAMMRNKMKENVTGVVDIQDMDPKTFSDFLSYLYTGNTEYITPENVAQLYTAADKYQVEVLKENCLDYMLANVSIENFCDIFAISIQHNEEKLKETCFKYFGKHFLDVIQTCKWQSFLCENPIICNELLIKYAKLNNKNTFS